jgi:hypothetical protein
MAVAVKGPPDAAALLSRVDAVGGASLSSANVGSWAKEAEDLLLTLEQATIDHPATTRPLYQRLLRDLVHDRSHFDVQEDRQVLFDVGERTTAGLVRACLGEPMSPDELAGWVLDLQLEDTGYSVEVADLVEALGARGWLLFGGGWTSWTGACLLRTPITTSSTTIMTRRRRISVRRSPTSANTSCWRLNLMSRF